MCNKIVPNFILCFAAVLAAVAPALSQTPRTFDITAFLREVKRKSEENWRKGIAEYSNYSYKWRKVWREAGKNGKIREKSELYELFFPLKCPVKKCHSVWVLLEKDGKPVAAEKIEKQRIKAGEKLEQMESDARAQTLYPNTTAPLNLMKFNFSVRRPFSSEWEIDVSIDGPEILEQCEFFAPQRETINGWETIGLSFRPRRDAVFSEATKYMPQAEGKIWIDAEEKVLMRLVIWQKGTKFSENATSDELLARAALVRDMTRTEEGVWFPRLGRINALDNPNLFAEMKSDFSIEYFDHHRFKTEIKTVEIK